MLNKAERYLDSIIGQELLKLFKEYKEVEELNTLKSFIEKQEVMGLENTLVYEEYLLKKFWESNIVQRSTANLWQDLIQEYDLNFLNRLEYTPEYNKVLIGFKINIGRILTSSINKTYINDYYAVIDLYEQFSEHTKESINSIKEYSSKRENIEDIFTAALQSMGNEELITELDELDQIVAKLCNDIKVLYLVQSDYDGMSILLRSKLFVALYEYKNNNMELIQSLIKEIKKYCSNSIEYWNNCELKNVIAAELTCLFLRMKYIKAEDTNEFDDNLRQFSIKFAGNILEVLLIQNGVYEKSMMTLNLNFHSKIKKQELHNTLSDNIYDLMQKNRNTIYTKCHVAMDDLCKSFKNKYQNTIDCIRKYAKELVNFQYNSSKFIESAIEWTISQHEEIVKKIADKYSLIVFKICKEAVNKLGNDFISIYVAKSPVSILKSNNVKSDYVLAMPEVLEKSLISFFVYRVKSTLEQLMVESSSEFEDYKIIRNMSHIEILKSYGNLYDELKRFAENPKEYCAPHTDRIMHNFITLLLRQIINRKEELLSIKEISKEKLHEKLHYIIGVAINSAVNTDSIIKLDYADAFITNPRMGLPIFLTGNIAYFLNDVISSNLLKYNNIEKLSIVFKANLVNYDKGLLYNELSKYMENAHSCSYDKTNDTISRIYAVIHKFHEKKAKQLNKLYADIANIILHHYKEEKKLLYSGIVRKAASSLSPKKLFKVFGTKSSADPELPFYFKYKIFYLLSSSMQKDNVYYPIDDLKHNLTNYIENYKDYCSSFKKTEYMENMLYQIIKKSVYMRFTKPDTRVKEMARGNEDYYCFDSKGHAYLLENQGGYLQICDYEQQDIKLCYGVQNSVFLKSISIINEFLSNAIYNIYSNQYNDIFHDAIQFYHNKSLRLSCLRISCMKIASENPSDRLNCLLLELEDTTTILCNSIDTKKINELNNTNGIVKLAMQYLSTNYCILKQIHESLIRTEQMLQNEKIIWDSSKVQSSILVQSKKSDSDSLSKEFNKVQLKEQTQIDAYSLRNKEKLQRKDSAESYKLQRKDSAESYKSR